MNNIDKIYNQNKKSGWVKIFIGLAFLVLAIPLMIFGIGQASYNGITYMSPHNRRVRQVKRLETKKEKKEIKIKLEKLRETNKLVLEGDVKNDDTI